jgi:hypothetical protein
MKTITDVYNVFTYDELGDKAQMAVVNQTIQDWIECPDTMPYEAREDYYKAEKQANRMQTPWFFGEIIWEYCKGFVLNEAKQSYYLASGKWHSFIDD